MAEAGHVAVPDGRPPAHQAVVALQPRLLVVQQGLDRADVEHGQARPSAPVSASEISGKKAASVLPPAVGARTSRFAPVQRRLDGQLLHRPQRRASPGR